MTGTDEKDRRTREGGAADQGGNGCGRCVLTRRSAFQGVVRVLREFSVRSSWTERMRARRLDEVDVVNQGVRCECGQAVMEKLKMTYQWGHSDAQEMHRSGVFSRAFNSPAAGYRLDMKKI